ncbi:hypothetical protein [Novosphingobium sp. Leaf2]|uniref:hypothetical protein n=1 Tax=Novosphingobium sp. Leaf2 TaxID=1735670 RepID=UPI00138F2054|nr:hypothetical protein [Novosphingobium sp. Leaf2]
MSILGANEIEAASTIGAFPLDFGLFRERQIAQMLDDRLPVSGNTRSEGTRLGSGAGRSGFLDMFQNRMPNSTANEGQVAEKTHVRSRGNTPS